MSVQTSKRSRYGNWTKLTLAALSLSCAGLLSSACAGTEPEDDGTGNGGTSVVGVGGMGGQPMGDCAIDCSTLPSQPCLTSICDPATDKCAYIPEPDGSACDDGEFCTVNESCTAGVCGDGEANTCELTAGACDVTVACNEATDTCTFDKKPEGSPCQPDNACEVNGLCSAAGACLGAPKDCSLAPVPSECFNAACNPQSGQCEPVAGNDGVTCSDDADKCMINGVCAAGACANTVPKDCSNLTMGCDLGVCDTVSGMCGVMAVQAGQTCDDSNGCSLGETCDNAGVCGGGALTTSCVNNDQCCPSGCNETNDTDCILDILLLGDDVADTMGSPGWPDYRAALNAAGVTWQEHNLDVMTTFPTAAELANYNTVIWFDTGTITADADAQIVADWMLSAGKQRLFVTGNDFLWDYLGFPSASESALSSLWGLVYGGDGAGTAITSIVGVANDPISGSFVGGLTITNSTADYAAFGMGAATHAGVYGPGGGGSGETALSHYSTADYEVVWLGVRFHSDVTSATQRNTLMTNIVNWFK